MAVTVAQNIIKHHNLYAKKELGQNFIIDDDITDKIVLLAPNFTNATVLEVGPGPGSLTRSILKLSPKTLYAIEYDKRITPVLEEIRTSYPEKFVYFIDDALHFNYSILPNKLDIIANLPYNIGTALFIQWLKSKQVANMTVMLQKEVAMRIVAKPRTKDYGRLSILSQTLANCKIVMELEPKDFSPPPKVSSAVVVAELKNVALDFNIEALEKVTEAGFGMRRKKIRSSLAQIISEKELYALSINPDCRAEELSIEDFSNIAKYLTRTKI